jgi:hypothetical protein
MRIYDHMGDYRRALSFYERAVDTGERSLPENHPCCELWKENLESVKKKL